MEEKIHGAIIEKAVAVSSGRCSNGGEYKGMKIKT
jgi:hypothetical protein